MSDRLTTATAQAVAKRAENENRAPSIASQLNQPWVAEQVARQLGQKGDAQALIRSVLTAIRNAPDLEQCDPQTVIGGMFLAAQLGLEIGGGLGQAYLIPRENRRNERYWGEASMQIGYPGLIKLASNSGMVVGFDTIIVREGDTFVKGASSERGKFFDMQYGDNNDDRTVPIKRVIGLVWLRGNPRPQWRDLTIDQIEARRPDYTKERTGRNGTYLPNTPWKTHYDAMCEKTAMIEALRFVPKSADLALAINADDMVMRKAEAGDVTIERTDGRREALTGPPAADGARPGNGLPASDLAPQAAAEPSDDTGVDPEQLRQWEAQQQTEFWSHTDGAEFQ